jgi:hypothetical protein
MKSKVELELLRLKYQGFFVILQKGNKVVGGDCEKFIYKYINKGYSVTMTKPICNYKRPNILKKKRNEQQSK